MGHSHAHGASRAGPPAPRLVAGLAVALGLIAVATVAGLVALWPDSADVPHAPSPYGGQGVSVVDGVVRSVAPFDCGADGTGPDNTPAVAGDCARVTASVADADGGTASFVLDPTRYLGARPEAGDRVRLVRTASGGEATYQFLDFRRGMPMALLALVFAVAVALVGRWRGLFALVGVAVTLLALGRFVLPALLAGKPALPVAVVGSTAIMLVVLYLAHGISVRTTAALFGTLFGIGFTATLGLLATDWTSLTGIGSEDDRLLVAIAPAVSLTGVVAASMVIAGLGVLNDVTVTQASAVWELRALDPRTSRRALFGSAMRIGRDHIASSVYTLVFAYAGSAMTIMLLISAYQLGFREVITSEQIAPEIVRTLVGVIGLVLAVPATTLVAVWLAPGPGEPRRRGAHAG